MSPTSDFAFLLQRVNEGCEQAKQELFERYGAAVRRAVRYHLHDAMRRHYDSMDFEQSVWAAFFLGDLAQGDFPTPDALIGFLAKVAQNKIVTATRRRLDQGHDQRRECSLDAPVKPGAAAPLGDSIAGPTHTPSQYVMADESWNKLKGKLPPQQVRILELLRAGHSQTDVAERVGCNTRTIRRLLDALSLILGEP